MGWRGSRKDLSSPGPKVRVSYVLRPYSFSHFRFIENRLIDFDETW